jgi:hypothetical protein
MLRIRTVEAAGIQRLILCGQLAGPWVEEFRINWDRVRTESCGSRFVIDLSDVTFIDEAGESLLRSMGSEGVEFIAAGVDTKYLLTNLKNTRRPSLRRSFAHLENGCAPGDEHK